MFRSSFWLVCAFLLCFEQTFSENVTKMDDAPELHKEKKTVISPTAPHSANPTSHSESDLKPKSETPDHQPKPIDAITPESNTTTSKDNHFEPINPAISKNDSQPEPTTATPKPNVTTSTQSPSTSTKSSSTAPPAPITSTPIPVTPKPEPQKGSWNVTIKNITCLRIDGIFSIDFTYPIGNKTNETIHYDVPKGAHSNGTSCEKITLWWKVNNIKINQLEFIFQKHGNKSYVLHSLAVEVYVPKLNKTETFNNTNSNETYFETPVGQSYACSSMRKVKVNKNAKVIFDEFHLQAFKTSNSTGFDSSVDCAGSTPHTADIVPIVVGCVLALLVIAVLVAYLISRRRSQTRGYLSM